MSVETRVPSSSATHKPLQSPSSSFLCRKGPRFICNVQGNLSIVRPLHWFLGDEGGVVTDRIQPVVFAARVQNYCSFRRLNCYMSFRSDMNRNDNPIIWKSPFGIWRFKLMHCKGCGHSVGSVQLTEILAMCFFINLTSMLVLGLLNKRPLYFDPNPIKGRTLQALHNIVNI